MTPEEIEADYAREERAAIQWEGQLSDIGRAYLEAQASRITVADGVDPELANIAARDADLLAVAKGFGGLEIISAHCEAQEVAA